MANEKKPAVLVIAGVIEIVFSIFIFIYAIVSMVSGCIGSVAGAVGTAGGASMTEESAKAAMGGAGIMIIVNVIIGLIAIVLGVIGIIAASNLFKGKKAGVGLSNFWAIALFVIFVIGLVPAIIQLSSAAATAGALTDLTKSAGDAGSQVSSADVQAFTTGLPVMMIVWSGIVYLLPAIVVFILLKLKPVKDYFAAAPAAT